MIAQEDISGWSQFGLAGLVIGALFFALILVVRWMVAHIDAKDERHINERRDWLQAVSALADSTRELAELIRDIKELVGRNRSE